LSVRGLPATCAMSRLEICSHLVVLAEAGLIVRTKTGRTVACALNADPMQAAMEWLDRYQRFWYEQLDRLTAFVEEESCPPSPASSPSQAWSSSVASTRRQPRSTKRGPTRRK